jgi:nicotinamide-nucleotide amidase
MDGQELQTLAMAAGAALRRAGWRLAVAESCTGGWLAKVLTDQAGSSEYFNAGFVTYADSAKSACLAVPATVLAEHGAVSLPVVQAMVQGALQLGSADLAVATSGVAGPDGGTADKPVGLVWFGVTSRAGALQAEKQIFQGDRTAIRLQAVAHALRLIAAAAASPSADSADSRR